MKIRFTIQSPQPLTFDVEVATNEDAWRALDYLVRGTVFPITHVVVEEPK